MGDTDVKDRTNIEEAKARLPMPALLDRLAPDWRKKNPLRPDDRKISFGANDTGWSDHGTGDKGDQITFLEKFEGLSRGDAIRRFVKLAGVEASRKNGHLPKPPNIDWSACVAALTDAKAQELVDYRGYSLAFVQWLIAQGLVGIYRDDRGVDQFAFPLHDDFGAVVGVHHKHSDGKWRTLGATRPLIIGDRKVPKWIVFESQWDAFAVMEALDYHLPGYEPSCTILITRGAENGKFASIIPAEAEVIVVMQNDAPKPDGTIPSDNWLEKIKAVCPARLLVARPPPDVKDANDWLKRGDADFNKMLWDAETVVAGTLQPEPMPEIVEAGENSANSTNSTPLPSQDIPTADYPKDSFLSDFVEYARTQSEALDSILIAVILPVIAALLGRRVYIQFGSKKYPNLFNMIVARPGDRKTSTVQIADEIATRLLPLNGFVWGVCSDQSLFQTYQANPDKLWIIPEGNPLLANWAHDAAGKQVAKRMLDLYDCQRWNQNYIKQEKESGQANETIPETSTSFLIATTFNSARFNGLETRDGMRRRTSYYVSEGLARTIYWPANNAEQKEALIAALQPLLQLSGEMRLAPESLDLWKTIQDGNREEIDKVHGFDSASEALGTTLSESPSKILKRAMIFEVCRWLKDSSRDWKSIQPGTLQIAANHEKFCVHSSRILDTIGIRAEVRNEADILLAKVRTDFGSKKQGNWISLTKSEITSKFAPHSSRPGTITPERIYGNIIPDLVKRGLAKLEARTGKREVFGFLADDPIRAGGDGKFVENGEITPSRDGGPTA